MRNTEITYKNKDKVYKTVVNEYDFTKGDISYPEGVINQCESLTNAGAVILKIIQFGTKEK